MLLILEELKQTYASRAYLKKSGLSFLTPKIYNSLAMRGLYFTDIIGDINKSWEIHEIINVLRSQNPSPKSSYLDMGAYGSELPRVLNSMGYKNISAVDLNPNIKTSRHGLDFCKNIIIGDMYDPKVYKNNKYKLISILSVLEHGYDLDKFVSIISKILSKDGLLFISVDFSSKKLNTKNMNLFGLSWDIFTPKMVIELENRLADIGVLPLIKFDYKKLKSNFNPINHGGLDYTFAFMAFKKSN